LAFDSRRVPNELLAEMSSAMEQTIEAACMEREIPGAVLLAEDKSGM